MLPYERIKAGRNAAAEARLDLSPAALTDKETENEKYWRAVENLENFLRQYDTTAEEWLSFLEQDATPLDHALAQEVGRRLNENAFHGPMTQRFFESNFDAYGRIIDRIHG